VRTCPTCGEPCAQAWCGFCERFLPLERGCAFGECTDPECYICVTMQAKFKTEHCTGQVGDKPCRLVARHRGPCLPGTKKRETPVKDGDRRDGAPTIAGWRRK